MNLLDTALPNNNLNPCSIRNEDLKENEKKQVIYSNDSKDNLFYSMNGEQNLNITNNTVSNNRDEIYVIFLFDMQIFIKF